MPKISAQFGSTCPVCGKRVEQGSTIWYSPNAPRGKKAQHYTCWSVKPTQQRPIPEPSKPARKPVTEEVFHTFPNTFQISGAGELADVGTITDVTGLGYLKTLAKEGKRWLGHDNIADAITALTHGWPAGVARLEAAFDDVKVEFEAQNRRRKGEWADQGDQIDMQRVWSGDLNRAWRRTRRQNRSSPGVVTIAVHHSISYGVHSDQLFWSGAAALKLASDLEASGHSVEILVVETSNGLFDDAPDDKNSCNCIVTAKEAGEPIDLAAIAGIVCSGGTMRYFCLARACALGYTVNRSFGIPDQRLPIELENRERLVVVHATQIADATQAAAWVVSTGEALHSHELEAA